jgi:hypothetical protein
MVGRLGGVSVGVPDVHHGIMIRPGSTTSCTSLPPIAKVIKSTNNSFYPIHHANFDIKKIFNKSDSSLKLL